MRSMRSVHRVWLPLVLLLPVGLWAELTPVFQYAFPASFDGGSTTITDLSPAGNGGVMDFARGYLNGDAPPGETGGSITGSNGAHGRTNAINLLSNSQVAAHGGFTMDVWFSWEGTYTNVRKLLDYAGTESLQTRDRTIRFMLSASDAQVVSVPIEANRWYHVVAEFDTAGNAIAADGSIRGESRLWLDDLSGNGLVLVASAATVKTSYGDSLARPIGINRWAGGGADYNQGKIYNPAVYLGVIRATSWMPAPADKKALVSTATELSWLAPDRYAASGYDIYFDPNQNKVVQGDPAVRLASRRTETFVQFGSPLAYNTTYYWRVDAYEPNAPGPDILHAGRVWSFTTEPEIPIVDVSPRDQIVPEGATATFTVQGRNQTQIAWYFSADADLTPAGDERLDGNGAALTVSDVTAGREGYIYCVLSNGAGQTLSQPALLMTQRLVARWEFDGTLADTLGVHDGMKVGDPNFVTDSLAGGQALTLDGDGAVKVPYSRQLNTESFTVMAWAKATGGAGLYRALISNRNDVPKYGYIVYAANNDKWQYWSPTEAGGWGSLYTADATTDVVLNKWVFVAISFEADGPADDAGFVRGSKKLFVNGLLAASQEEAVYSRNQANPMLIGAGANELPLPDYYFQGLIDDVQMYNYAVDPFAIAADYVRLVPEARLCVSYPGFDVTGLGGVPDCRVDLLDLAAFMADWLQCNLVAAEGGCQ